MTKNNALIGYNGFIGSSLRNQYDFNYLYNTKNISEIRGHSFDMVVCAAPGGTKWRANKDHVKDTRSVVWLMDELSQVKTKKFILISTIDVYPFPHNVDEDHEIKKTYLSPYGENRLRLSDFVQENFNATTVRLPSLFGEGMWGGVLWDVINNNKEYLPMSGVVQLYHIDNLWKDISKAVSNDIGVLNMATEFIQVNQLKEEVSGVRRDFGNEHLPIPYHNMISKYAKIWGVHDKYLYTKEQVIDDIIRFIG